jgi:hypothetical protein
MNDLDSATSLEKVMPNPGWGQPIFSKRVPARKPDPEPRQNIKLNA